MHLLIVTASLVVSGCSWMPDFMKRIAAPMIGGLVTSFILELLVYPAIYKLWKGRTELSGVAVAGRLKGRISNPPVPGAMP